MRNKIKQLMNKEEGFTLVELLAVIVILGIILAIAIPSIGNVIDDSRTKATAAETELVEDAARLYFTAGEDSNGVVIPESTTTVKVSELKAAGFLDKRDSTISDDRTVTRDDGTYTLN